MKKIKLKLWQKTLIALFVLGAATAATGGLMVTYALNSDELNGANSVVDKNQFLNDFSKIYNEDGSLKPVSSIVDPEKKKKVANISDDGKTFNWVGTDKYIDFHQFFKEYHAKYNDNFVQKISYGSFSFYNEYVVAVRPDQFLEFTKWFILNVSWGPDLLTLDSFRLVPGVKRSGSSVTLGSHANSKKEVNEIKFYPDAFFGSLPIYSVSSGAGNARDSLSDAVFSIPQNREETERFFKSIPLLSAYKNSTSFQLGTFKNIYLTGRLIDKEVLVSNQPFDDNEHVILKNMSQSEFDEYVANNFPADHPERSKLVYSNFAKYRIKELKNQNRTKEDVKDGTTTTINYLVFELKLSKLGDTSKELTISLSSNNDSTPTSKFSKSSKLSTESLKELSESDLLNFLDFYDVNNYLNSTFYLSEDSVSQKMSFYFSRLEAIQKAKGLSYDQVKKWQVTNFRVSEGKLYVSLEGQDETPKVNGNNSGSAPVITKRTKEIVFDSKNMNLEETKRFLQFKTVIGYKGSIKPITIEASAEDSKIPLPKDREATRLDKIKYQIYNETYPDLIEIVKLKYPELLKTYYGPHVQQVLNDKGYYEYEIKDGEYRQFTLDERIGIPTLLHATDENYEGVSADFLKYVGAHEYGHHITLEKTGALDEKDKGVLVSGLSSWTGTDISNYYNFDALQNYLDARSGLIAKRYDAEGNPNPNGVFLNFEFIKKDGQVEGESHSDVWGSKKGNKDIYSVLSNPRRRFLQDFNGLKKAAMERNVNLGDLFLANSFDTETGTINPFIAGRNEAIVKNDKGESVFKPIKRLELLKKLTDGAGNKLTFVNEDGVERIKVFDYKLVDEKLVVTKVLIKNPDGSDVVNIPLNVPLDNNDIIYLRIKEQEIRISFEILVAEDLFDSGWNTNETSLGVLHNSSVYTYSGKTNWQFIDEILSRNNPIEFDPKNNTVNIDNILDRNPRVDSRNVNIKQDDELSKQLFTLLYSRIRNESNAANKPKWFNKNTILQFVSSNGDNSFSPNDSYIVSDNKNTEAFFRYVATDSIIDRDDVENKAITEIVKLNKSDPSKYPALNGAKINTDIGSIFRAILNQAKPRKRMNNQGVEEVQNPWYNFFKLLNEDNKSLKNKDTKTSKNTDDNSNLFYEVTQETKSKKPFEFTTSSGHMSKDLVMGSVHKIAIDMQHPLFEKIRQIFGNSFKKGLSVSDGKLNYLAFEKLQDFIEFISIDYSKAIKGNQIKSVDGQLTSEFEFNWDINYVKTKFDFEEFKKTGAENAKLSDQELANKLMKLFANSILNMLTKNFKVDKDLQSNLALFSSDYGINLYNQYFKKIFKLVKTPFSNPVTRDEFNQLDPNEFVESIKRWVSEVTNENNKQQAIDNIDLLDLLYFAGNRFWYYGSNHKDEATVGRVSKRISNDVRQKNITRIENRLSNIFTDYVYKLSETLTRDYVQTTFVPKTKDFDNLGKFVGGANHKNTGIEWVLDTTSLGVWNQNKMNNSPVWFSSFSYFKSLAYDELNAEIKKIDEEYNPKIKNNNDQLINLESLKASSIISETRYNNKKAALLQEKIKLLTEKNEKLQKTYATTGGSLGQIKIYKDGSTRDSSYFGRILQNADGYYKDRFQKKQIGKELYDENLNEVIDPTIRTKDFDGNPVTSVPKAFFISQMLNYGVGSRNIAGLFRNKELDAASLYGFIKNDVASKIKKLRFRDIKSGEVKYLNVNISDTNNLFYLKKQADISSKVTLHDLGYSSWVSDYALMGKYRDALLRPNNAYQLDFVDENNNIVEEGNLGSLKTLTENGKTPQQSPIIIKTQLVNDQASDQSKQKAVLSVDFQFNIQR